MKRLGKIGWTTLILAALLLLALPAQAQQKLVLTAGDYYLDIDPDTGQASEIGRTPGFTHLRGLTYDRMTGTLFAINFIAPAPELVMLDEDTGEVTVIGPITLDGSGTDVSRAEGMSWNPADGKLYATIGTGRRSNTIVTLDPETGRATRVVGVSGTIEGELDAIEFVGTELYGIDLGGPPYLYRVDLGTGRASFVGNLGNSAGAEMAWDPDAGILYGFTEHSPWRLLSIDWHAGSSRVVGVMYDVGEFASTRPSGIAAVPAPLVAAVDVKPGSCPNPLNTKSRGVLPVAIVGMPGFDVTMVDPLSVRLEGVPPLRSSIEDVAAPFEPLVGKESCELDCAETGPDGIADLTLKFRRQEVLDALGPVEDGQCVVLRLTGSLTAEHGGRGFHGEDVVLIIDK